MQEADCRRQNQRARALGAHERTRDVRALLRQQIVQIVTRHAPRNVRIALTHFVAILLGQHLQT
jgi:hypothetical protein